ncbi:MAG: tetratricopeptide repeat protein [Magnetococcus sp. DMHC-1]
MSPALPCFSANQADRSRFLYLAAFLVLLTAIIPFFQARAFDFIAMDDPSYVYENPFVREGITWSGVRWALTSTHYGWLPLTRLSLMLDVTLFGVNPGAIHLCNLFFHACNALLIFLLLQRATGSIWTSALTAILFAVHPLRVESVVWISERKDVLFAFFVLLALYSYQEARNRREWYRLFPSLCLFLLAGMAKPMAVTLPIMLLLWDYWPLQRFPGEWRRMLLEKIPFFLLAGLLAGITVAIAHDLGTLPSTNLFPFPDRLANAVISYGVYLRQTFWPTDLDFFYLHPLTRWQGGHLLLSGMLLGLITFYAVRHRRQAPHLLFGWLWFLGTLLPVIGLLQGGALVRADRFTYMPHLGLGVAITWEMRRLFWQQEKKLGIKILLGLRPKPRQEEGHSPSSWTSIPVFHLFSKTWLFKVILLVFILLFMALLIHITWLQAGHWRNTATLTTHSLAISGPNYINLRIQGLAYANQNDWEKALDRLQQSLQRSPHDLVSQRAVANALIHVQRYAEALDLLQKIISETPPHHKNHMLAGVALLQLDRTAEALHHFEQAFPLHPNPEQLMDQVGVNLARKGQIRKAIDYFRRAQALQPDSFALNMHLGMALEEDPSAALPFLQRAGRLQPNHLLALYHLGKTLNRLKDHTQAAAILQQAMTLQPRDPDILFEMAYALAKLGERQAAIGHLENLLHMQPEHLPARQLLEVVRKITP